MVNQFLKKKSKRVSTRKRVKIERKVREHNRKIRKAAKTQGKRKKKDPGVPNDYPFKDEVLKEAQEWKEKKEAERERKKNRSKMNKKKMEILKKKGLTGLLKDAQSRTDEYNRKRAFVEERTSEYQTGKAVETSLKAFYKEFSKVIEAADVIIQVLDARDPLGSRCRQVEEAVLNAGHSKKLVLLLNKIDLVPKDNAEKWLTHLRNEFPTVAFKASTQLQKSNLSQVKVPINLASNDLLKTSRCLGADTLMKLLGNYCRNKEIKTTIRVGIVGFPNTGKSSVINSLKRTRSCNVGATPGVTRAMQEVQLDKHIRLLDSPGIVMTPNNSDAAAVLRNCVRLETIQDPMPAISAILNRCQKQQLMFHYTIEQFSDAEEFLALLARRYGMLRKGGIPNLRKAAKKVLQDWNFGRITYYTHPPEQHTLPSHLSAEIVSEMGKEFDIDALIASEEDSLKELRTSKSSDIVMSTQGIVDEDMFGEQDDDEDDIGGEIDSDEKEEDENDDDRMEEDNDGQQELANTMVTFKSRKHAALAKASQEVPAKRQKFEVTKKEVKKVATRANAMMSAEESVIPGNQQLNTARKLALKKQKREKKRAYKIGEKLADSFSGALAGLGSTSNDDYNFDVDFN